MVSTIPSVNSCRPFTGASALGLKERGALSLSQESQEGAKAVSPSSKGIWEAKPNGGPRGISSNAEATENEVSSRQLFFFKAGNAIHMEFTIIFRVLLTSFHKRNPVFPER